MIDLVPVLAVASIGGRLGLHRNTIAYRLKRVRELTGQDPLDPKARLLLHLALLAAALPPAPNGAG